MRPQAAYAELIKLAREETLLASCAALLGWDELTYMPDGAVEGQVESHARSFGLAIHLQSEEQENPFVDKVFRHRTFFSRLHHFVRLSSAFIVMPGGIGTALELFMVWQLLQVKHMKEHPLILVGTMWPGLIEWMRATMVERGLVNAPDMDTVHVVPAAPDAIAIIQSIAAGAISSYSGAKGPRANFSSWNASSNAQCSALRPR